MPELSVRGLRAERHRLLAATLISFFLWEPARLRGWPLFKRGLVQKLG